MCFSSPSIPAPPPQPDTSAQDEAAADERKRLRQQQNLETAKLKEEAFEDRLQAYYGKRGRGSLLTGQGGGKGFALETSLMSKKNLGA